jgi:hypothetical protein
MKVVEFTLRHRNEDAYHDDDDDDDDDDNYFKLRL